MAEQERYSVDQQGYYRESNHGRLRPFAVSEVIFDGPAEEQRRRLNREMVANPNLIKRIKAPRSGNQAIYDAIKRADTTRPKAMSLTRKPRGYSDAYWAMQMKQAKKTG